MSPADPARGVTLSMNLARPGPAAPRRARAGRRRRSGRPWGLEPLEGRVVPATIPVTSLADAGPGTLRAAIEQANLDPAPDTITFDPSVRGTITLTSALPDLSTAITIDGPGPQALTVARPYGPGALPLFRIFTVPAGAVVTISGLTISGGGDGGGLGGGIENAGTLAVTDSTLSGNSAALGGGIENGGNLAVTDSTLTGNSAGEGGGIYNADTGTLTVTDSTLTGNSAFSTLLPIGFVGGNGGGIYNGGRLAVTDSTLSGNSAGAFGEGGGISNVGKLAVRMSIFANSVGGNLGTFAGSSFVSLGHDLFSDSPGAALDSTDLIDTDPRLGPLADNGGPTQTMALLPGSPAVDAGVAVPGVTTDQRGVPRPQGAAPDIGAFESRGFTLAVVGGGDQQAPPGTAFPAPLVVAVSSPFGEPVAGGRVTFTAPPTGPSANFGGNPAPLDASGHARVNATANGLGGTYTVTVATTGADSAALTLTNVVIPPTVLSLRRTGIHDQPTHLVLTFDRPMSAATVQDLRNYLLFRVGPHGVAGPHPQPIPIASAVYDPAARAVTLTPLHRLDLHRYYRLTASGTAPAGLRSVDGVLLDGSGRGQPGTDYVALVHGFAAVAPVSLPAGPLGVMPRAPDPTRAR
jgi:hypothetical protein